MAADKKTKGSFEQGHHKSFMFKAASPAAWSKCPPWRCPCASAPAPPRGAPCGSLQFGTPRVEARPVGSQPQPQLLELAAPKVADFTAFDIQAPRSSSYGCRPSDGLRLKTSSRAATPSLAVRRSWAKSRRRTKARRTKQGHRKQGLEVRDVNRSRRVSNSLTFSGAMFISFVKAK